MQSKNNRFSLPRVGIDLMGGDIPSCTLLEELLPLFKKKPFCDPIFFGNQETLSLIPPSFKQVLCKETIEMKDNPLSSVRLKKESSMVCGIKALQKDDLEAFVSLGNTGALLASSKLFLSPLAGIERPAFITTIATRRNVVAVLDVGATLSCSADHLVQFALMGIAFQESQGIEHPKVALLNVGTEENKGGPVLQEAFIKLKKYPQFIGNIEGREVFEGTVDVLLTDGWTGNIFLKTAEGSASFIFDHIQHTISLPPEALEVLQKKVLYTEYPGAVLAGVDKIVLKCHGNSTATSFFYGIQEACSLIEKKWIHKIKLHLGLESGRCP